LTEQTLADIWMSGLVFIDGGKAVVATSISRKTNDRTVMVWDVERGEARWSQSISEPATMLVALDESWVCTFGKTHFKLWNLATGELLRQFDRTLHPVVVTGANKLLTIESLPTQRVDGSTYDSGQILFVFSPATGTVESYVGLGMDAYRVALLGNRLVCSGLSKLSGGNELSVFDLVAQQRTSTVAVELKGHLVLRSNGELLVPMDFGGPSIVDPLSGRTIDRIQDGDRQMAGAFALSPDGRLLVTSHGWQEDNHSSIIDHCLRVWDLDQRKLVRCDLLGGQRIPSALRITNDAAVLAASANRELTFWHFGGA